MQRLNVFIVNTDLASFSDPAKSKPEVWVTSQLAFSGGLRKYGEALGKVDPGDCCLMYESGTGVIGVGFCKARWDGVAYDESRYYETPLLYPPEYRLAVDWGESLLPRPLALGDLGELCGYKPSFSPLQSVQRVSAPSPALLDWIADARSTTAPFRLAEEFHVGSAAPSEMWEGAVTRIEVNRFERSAAARNECIAKWGTRCHACGLDFEERYGDMGRGFIHVHHLTPISSVGQEYRLDPVNDLRPLCPNCHAMIHRADPPLTPEALKARVRLNKQDADD